MYAVPVQAGGVRWVMEVIMMIVMLGMFFIFFFPWFELTLISKLNINLTASEPLPGQWSFPSFTRTETF